MVGELEHEVKDFFFNPLDANIDPDYCAKYCRIAAKKHFDLSYSRNHAWGLAPSNHSKWKADNDINLVTKLNSYGINLNDFYSNKFDKNDFEYVSFVYSIILEHMSAKLDVGDIIGTYFTTSSANDNLKPYTHVVLYVGEKNGEGICHHQFGSNIVFNFLKSDLLDMPKDYVAKGGYLIPREIISSKKLI